MKEFLSGITGQVTAISIAAFVFGCCIITYHLSSFQIIDFDPLKPHAIIVGLAYFLFLGINIIFFSYRAGNIENHSFSTLKLIVQGLIKIPIIALVIFFICEPGMIVNPDYKLYFFKYSLDIKVFAILTMPMGLVLIIDTLAIKKEGVPERKFNVRIRNLMIFLLLVSVLLMFLTFIRNSTFQSILSLEGSICIFINFFIVGYRSSKLHDERVANNEGEKPKWTDDSFFNFGKSDLGIQLKKLFNILAIIFVALKITLNYTSVVFSNLSQSYGGGKLIKMSYVVDKDTVTGNKVYETDEYLFLAEKDSSIIKLDWKNINAILKSPRQKFDK